MLRIVFVQSHHPVQYPIHFWRVSKLAMRAVRRIVSQCHTTVLIKLTRPCRRQRYLVWWKHIDILPWSLARFVRVRIRNKQRERRNRVIASTPRVCSAKGVPSGRALQECLSLRGHH